MPGLSDMVYEVHDPFNLLIQILLISFIQRMRCIMIYLNCRLIYFSQYGVRRLKYSRHENCPQLAAREDGRTRNAFKSSD